MPKLKSKEKNALCQYGNYCRYYGYRNPDNEDNRLKVLAERMDLFYGKDVLDIGCNIGHVTFSIARDFGAKSVVGMDIDRKLINIARKNVQYYINDTAQSSSYLSPNNHLKDSVLRDCNDLNCDNVTESLPSECRPIKSVSNTLLQKFPNNVSFVQGNYVLKSNYLLSLETCKFDIILCLSITKWLHLNWGDDGLKRSFKRMFAQLRPGGILVVEPQPWKSYGRRKTLTETICQNYKNILLKPPMFTDYLLNEVGFANCETLTMPHNPSKGFQRPLKLYRKPKILLPAAVSAQLPNLRALKRTIQRVRQIKQIAPANPNSLRFEIPDSFKKTLCGEQFLFFDSADSGNFEDRILIFSTSKNLELLTYSKHWFADGTFSSCPNLFYQLFTIHTIQFSNVIPLVYILLPDKKENTYSTMFRNLKLIKPDLNPISILIDFEKAVINSIKTEFPQTKIQGCFFHLSQALWRHIQEYGLQTQYCNDPVFALELKKLAALAFVPIEKVIEYFEGLLENEFYTKNEKLLSPLISYFECTWIGSLDRRGKRRSPLFAIDLWNCFNRLKDNLPRTNNNIEGWHNGFSALLTSSHPTIWKFINCLKKEESINKITTEQLIAGDVPPKKLKYKDTAKKILHICEDFENRQLNDFLQGIAHNFNLNM
ncbi:hypothetical protein QTP88_000404 [Uroleucon formosanum]